MSILFPYSIPRSGFIGRGGPSGYIELDPATSYNKASTDKDALVYPIGTVIGYFNASIGGYGACVYMIADEASSEPIVLANVVTMKSGSHTILTNDASAGAVGNYAANAGVPAAIAIGAMTTDYYGWFWFLGVCPDLYTAASTKLGASSALTSAGSIAAMSPFIASTTNDRIALHNRDAASTDVEVMGMSIAANSTNDNTLSKIRLFGTGWGV